jgi:hypothetical protein
MAGMVEPALVTAAGLAGLAKVPAAMEAGTVIMGTPAMPPGAAGAAAETAILQPAALPAE